LLSLLRFWFALRSRFDQRTSFTDPCGRLATRSSLRPCIHLLLTIGTTIQPTTRGLNRMGGISAAKKGLPKRRTGQVRRQAGRACL
jgi:hypothetical protein